MSALEDELGDIISKARLGLGLSPRQLADATGLTEHDIGEIESYRLTSDQAHLNALARALSLDPGKLAAIADGWAPAPVALSAAGLVVHTVSVAMGGYGENCYVVGCAETRSAAVVDPGGAVGKIIDLLASGDLRLDLILITHAHGDHIGGLRDLAAQYPDCRIVNHQLERDSVIGSFHNEWQPAKENVAIGLGKLTITPLFTPGHTPGSTCYHARDASGNGVCLVGDTLFSGSIGRPASPHVYKPMLSAIRSKILSLPDQTILLPGHGPATTAGEENDYNPFFQHA